jgi:hypothetical protein
MARIEDTDEIIDTRTLTHAVTVVGVFPSDASVREATSMLERAGFAPDRIGIVADNVRQAREMAGSYSPQGALAGAMIGALLTVAYLIFGGEAVRQNPVGIVLGGTALIVAFAAIGWLAGRARVFKQDQYEEFEDHVEQGETLLSVVCSTENGAQQARAMMKRAGATEVRGEPGSEAV